MTFLTAGHGGETLDWMLNLRPFAPRLFAVALAAGCTPEITILTEDQFCVEWAKRECEPVSARCSPFSRPQCEATRKLVCQDFAVAAKGGSRVYHPGSAEPCLARISDAYGKVVITPADLASRDAACAKVFQGSAKANEPCTADNECDGTLLCDKAKGRCGTPRTVGSNQGCANVGEVCVRGEYCHKDGNGVFTCSKKRALGMQCNNTDPCQENLRCAGMTNPRLCVDRLEQGATCSVHQECSTDFCDPYTRGCADGLYIGGDSSSCKAFGGASTPAQDAAATD